MFAKINHMAITSDHYALNGKFYEALFGMKPSSKPRPARAVVLGDGYVGLNIIPRREGRGSGLDHFGIEVDDIDLAMARMHELDPTVEVVKRPATRPFAAFSGHDPDGNVFDLSQQDMTNRRDIYIEGDWEQDRYINHYAVRTRNPEACAEFYADVLELTPANRKENDAKVHRVYAVTRSDRQYEWHDEDNRRENIEYRTEYEQENQ